MKGLGQGKKHDGQSFGQVGPDGSLILGEREAAELNRIMDEVERLDRLRTYGPIALSETPSGRVLSFTSPTTAQPIFGVLTGSANPYSYSQVNIKPDGTNEPTPSGKTGSAYEVNNLTGLDGKVEQLWPVLASDTFEVRFKHLRVTTPASPPPCTQRLTVNVNGCCTPLAGITVTVSAPASLSGTTNASGVVYWPLPANGTYTVTVSGLPSGYATPAAQTITVSGCNPVNVHFLALPDANNVCIQCCKTLFLKSRTFTLTDSAAGLSTTLTWNANAAFPNFWSGCILYPNVTSLVRISLSIPLQGVPYYVMDPDCINAIGGYGGSVPVWFAFSGCSLVVAPKTCFTTLGYSNVGGRQCHYPQVGTCGDAPSLGTSLNIPFGVNCQMLSPSTCSPFQVQTPFGYPGTPCYNYRYVCTFDTDNCPAAIFTPIWPNITTLTIV